MADTLADRRSPDPQNLGPELADAGRLFDELRENTLDPPGVTRATYGPGEMIAHQRVAARAHGLDLEVTTDYAGNLYMTLPGRDRAAPAIMIGSHLDSVPHGGNYDGAAGVVAGLVALQRLRRIGRTPAQDVTVMAIRAEETCWFSTHCAGSRMAFGLLPRESLDECSRMDTGRSLADHMKEEGFDPDAVRRGAVHLRAERIRCYIEPHIEQGPALVEAGIPVGIVSGIRGNLRYKQCQVTGVYGHAGAVPRRYRRDAVFAATEFVNTLERHWLAREAAGTDFVCTVGAMYTDATVHAMTKISGDVRFTMDIRSESNDVLLETDSYLREVARTIGDQRGVHIEIGAYTNAEPALMDAELRRMLREQADRIGIQWMELSSGAGHDCGTFANAGVPSAMIFVRNDHGSHNADEAMDIEDFAEGCRLLDALLDELG
ncbi:MAG: Zn-dependent hydrolase [Proteobacteria bacterium]|nr:Zn-dependent hydrolase [Pseudomonadota bacterium]